METLHSGGLPIRLHATEPPGPGPHPAILLLHGAGGNVDFWLDRISPLIARAGIAVFALHYFDRTSTTRASLSDLDPRGTHVPLWLATIQDALAAIALRPRIDPTRIALVGISLGAFLALAHATRSPGIRAIVDISGGLVDPFAAAATPTFPPTLILHGDSDTLVPIHFARNLAQTLTRLNVPHRLEILPGEGHWFSPAAQLRILTATASFLTTHLAR